MDPTMLALNSKFEVINMGQVHWLLGIQITVIGDLIEIS
jgi:hypothetical protein